MSAGVFEGLSTLRKKEDSKPKLPSEQATRLQQYFAERYGPINDDQMIDEKKKKKKKKSKKIKAEEKDGLVAMAEGRVRIVDEDITGFCDAYPKVNGSTYDDDDEDEDQPIVANAEEAEALRMQVGREKELLMKGGEAGGWTVVQHGINPDASPPRRQRHQATVPPEHPDASPPRRQRHQETVPLEHPDASPPRRQRHQATVPPERPDASPPRRQRHQATVPPERPDASPPRRRMVDGAATGMISGKELMEDMAKKREREAHLFSKLSDDVTGRGAETVYRSTSGQKVTQSEYVQLQEASKRSKKAKYDEEAVLPWGGGLKQREEREEQRRREQEEASRPFARGYDERLDLEQRGMARWGDPMAGLVHEGFGDGEEEQQLTALAQKKVDTMKRSGFIIPIEVPAHSWLRRGASAPPNRYNIKPGRHWDGVDRSNGFEKDYFKVQIEKQRQEQDAFMWAQGEM